MVAPVLGAGQMAAYRQALCTGYEKRTLVSVCDRNNRVLYDVSSTFQDGQVTVDVTRDVWRQATLSLVDPMHKYGFDSDTYNGSALQLGTYQVRVFTVIASPLLAHHVTIPVFHGPITRLERVGPVVTVEGQGREMRGVTVAWRTITYKRGAKRTDVIKAILRDYMGETNLSHIPDLPARMPADLTIHRAVDKPWKNAQKLAASLGMDLFYRADGYAAMRYRGKTPVWTLGDGWLTSPPDTSGDLQQVMNVTQVTGATPRGWKHPISSEAIAPEDHPLSPWNLGANNAPVMLVDSYNDPNIRTQAEADTVARERLANNLLLKRGVQYTGVPVPHLEPYDVVAAKSPRESPVHALEQFTIPLGISGDMSYGFVSPYRVKGTGHGH